MPEPTPDALRPFEQLRDRVMAAARELEHLREENARLAARITELEREMGAVGGGLGLALDEPPEQLRRHLERFITAVDRVLAGDLAAAETADGPVATEGDGATTGGAA